MPETRLVLATITHVDALMSWLTGRDTVATWGGPAFRYPFTRDSFLEDVRWGSMPTYVLLDATDAMVGFGQIYEKSGRGHLARLIVSRNHRHKGYGTMLVEQLCKQARELFCCSECSLYVLRSNHVAIRCYAKAGFEEAPFPSGDTHYPSQLFMIRKR